jgi:endonuclease YncB( thermonuclease family)
VLPAIAVIAALALFVARTRGRDGRQPDAKTFPEGTPVRLVHVVDGDTVYFELPDGRWVKARLAGINTPECEKRQVAIGRGRRSARCVEDDELYGMRAYEELRAILRDARLTLSCRRKRDGTCRRGSHGRVLARVRAGGNAVDAEMVRRGAAMTYTKYPGSNRARLCQLELAARSAKRGMWAHGSVPEVLAMMSPRTRAWYADHDRLCRAAVRRH